MALGARIRQARRARDLTQQELAATVGMTQSGLQALETRDSEASRYTLAIAEALGVKHEWLATGRGQSGLAALDASGWIAGPDPTQDPLEGADQIDFNELSSSEHVQVNVYHEVDNGSGSGQTTIALNPFDWRLLPKDRLQAAGVAPQYAAVYIVRGQSMGEVFPDGASIGVNQGEREIRDGHFYALDYKGVLMVRRLYRMPKDDGIAMMAIDRDNFPDEICRWDLLGDVVKILGRVFWSETYW